ncbi:hypothetical protein RUM44_003443 [Polyplax serrata]|uniref:Uncharacterized protein n=1 Tax=Polyplax serrata TaxID=468196 RepID=A0ABR1AGJ3_POLSC
MVWRVCNKIVKFLLEAAILVPRLVCWSTSSDLTPLTDLPLPSGFQHCPICYFYKWFRHISEAADAYKHKDSFGRSRRVDPTAQLPQSPPDTEAAYDSPEKAKEPEDSHESDRTKDTNELDTSGTSQEGAESTQSNDSSHQQSTLSTSHASPSSIASQESPEQGRKSDLSPSQKRKLEQVKLSTVQDSLIQPSEVVVSLKPVLTAEPILTPLEQIRVKDEEIRKALLAKQQLVADILHVPKDEFHTIAEMAGEPSIDREAAELVLAAVNQANQLAAAVNEALRLTEEEAVTFASEVVPGYSPRGGRRKTRLPGVPAQKIQGISSSLNFQLTQLLQKIVKERDEERELLRKELQRCREQIHVLHETHRNSGKSPSHSRLNEETADEPDDLARDDGTESNNDTEEEGNSLQHTHEETQETNPETGSEVFVDALSGDMEVLEAQPEASETEEELPV